MQQLSAFLIHQLLSLEGKNAAAFTVVLWQQFQTT